MFSIKVEEIPEEGLDLAWKEEPVALAGYIENLSDVDFEFETPLQSEANIRKLGESVLIAGKVQTALRFRCARCLKEFPYSITSEFELTFHPLKSPVQEEEVELSEKEIESNFFEGGEFRLSEIACEQIFLEIPVQPLCHETCKGLCPRCGLNLNLSSCDCEKEELESGFSVLKNLKIES